jgi:hypothetical protein
MNGLLCASEKGTGHRAVGQSISGFRAGRQKTRLMARVMGLGRSLLSLACVLAMAVALAAPFASVHAADSLVGGDRPDIRTPRVAPSPGVQRPGGSVSGSIGASSNCRSRCGSACQTMSCSGMNTATCNSIRQQCRMNCSSRC